MCGVGICDCIYTSCRDNDHDNAPLVEHGIAKVMQTTPFRYGNAAFGVLGNGDDLAVGKVGNGAAGDVPSAICTGGSSPSVALPRAARSKSNEVLDRLDGAVRSSSYPLRQHLHYLRYHVHGHVCRMQLHSFRMPLYMRRNVRACQHAVHTPPRMPCKYVHRVYRSHRDAPIREPAHSWLRCKYRRNRD